MKYYLDCEFLEGTQTKRFLGLPIGQTKPTIDLISIGIVAKDGREYYAISKDFNLREAWDRFDWKTQSTKDVKVYWVRENVLRPIFDEWQQETNGKIVRLGLPIPLSQLEFNYKNFKYCIQRIGKTNEQIVEEIKEFVLSLSTKVGGTTLIVDHCPFLDGPIKFYAYYADYDWVSLCWLFGKMNALPNSFPMYCINLKQEVDNKVSSITKLHGTNYSLKELESLPNYPKQTNEHNALSDARWNKKLHEFLQTI